MSQKSQQDWIDGAISALANGGVDAVKVEPLAKDLQVSKGSFYHHFANRRALLLALLEQWEQLGTSAIIDTVEALADDPAGRLAALVRVSCTPDELGDAVESSIRAWAATDAIAREAVARVDQRRLDYVTDLLVATGMPRPKAKRRAAMFYRVIIGDTAWRLAGGPAHSDVEFDELTERILSM